LPGMLEEANVRRKKGVNRRRRSSLPTSVIGSAAQWVRATAKCTSHQPTKQTIQNYRNWTLSWLYGRGIVTRSLAMFMGLAPMQIETETSHTITLRLSLQ